MPFIEDSPSVAGGRFLDDEPLGGRFLEDDSEPPKLRRQMPKSLAGIPGGEVSIRLTPDMESVVTPPNIPEQVKAQTWATLTPGEKLSLDLARGGRAAIEGGGLAAQGLGIASTVLPPVPMDMGGPYNPADAELLSRWQARRATQTPADIRQEIEVNPAFQAGTRLRATAEKTFPAVQPESVKRPIGALAEGVGSTVSFLPAGLAGPLGVAYMGALQNGAAAYDEALKNGANDEQAQEVFWWNAAGGTSEALPISRIFQRINKASGGTVGQALRGMLVSGLEEGTQETFQSTLQNATAKHIYDEERQYLEGVAQSGSVGFGTGFLLAALGMGTRGAAARINRPVAERRQERQQEQMAEEDRAQRIDMALQQDAQRQALEASVPLATGGRVVEVAGTDPRNIAIDDPRRLTVLPKRRSLRQGKQRLDIFDAVQPTEGGPDAITTERESGRISSQPVRTDAEREKIETPSPGDSIPGAAGQPPQGPGSAPIPIPAQAQAEWLINITPPSATAKGKPLPGVVQVDMMAGEVNTGSTNPDELRARGVEIPTKEEFYRLPKGRYTLRQALEMLAALPPVSTTQTKGGDQRGKEKVQGQKEDDEDVKPAGAAAPPSSLLPSKQTKPLEAQRDQIRRILGEIDRRRAEDLPLPSRAAEDALIARLKVIEEELYVRAKRPKQSEAVVPTKPVGEVLAAKVKSLPPNSSFVKVVNYDGITQGYVVVPHDGTPEGAVESLSQAQKIAHEQFEWKTEYYNIESQNGATGEKGELKWVISPNRQHVAEPTTDQARYILGDLSAKPRPVAALPPAPPAKKPSIRKGKPDAKAGEVDLTVTGQAKPVPGNPDYTYVVHRTRKEIAEDVGKYTVKINHATKSSVPTIYGSADSPQEAYAKALADLNAKPIATKPAPAKEPEAKPDISDDELMEIMRPESETDPAKFYYLEESSKSGFRAFTDPKTVTSPWFKTRRELAAWVQARQTPAAKDVAATDENLKNLSDAELDAMLDDVFEPKPKKAEPKTTAPRKPSSSIRKPKEEPRGAQAIRDEIKKLKQGLPVAEDMAMNDKGASLDRLEKKIAEAQARLDALLRPSEATPKPTEKSAAEIAAAAAKHGVKGVDEAVKGLHKLFGGGKNVGSSGLAFDEKTYAEAKPHFRAAYREFVAAGKSLKEFMQYVFENFGAESRQYLKRFVQDVQSGKIESEVTNETSTSPRSDVVGGTRPPKGAVAGEAGGAPGEQPVEGASGSGSATDVGDEARTPEDTQPAGGGGSGASGVRGAAKPGSRPGQLGEPPAAGGEGAGTVPPKVAVGKPKSLDPNSENHVINPGDEVAPKGAITKLRANINALMLLRDLEQGNRNATPEEKQQLARYTGWGSLSQVFDEAKARRMEQGWNRDEKWEEKWGKYYTQLKDLLTDEEWRASARSTQYAHFTSTTVISPMWDAVRQMGFFTGKVLEPAVGVGHFFGLAPESVREDAKFIGIDQDTISARIATKLYPKAKIFGKSFGDVAIPPNSVDLAITNVPFSARVIKDPNYPLGLNLHNWYIAKMLDAVKPGGLVVTITSGHTMDSQSAMRKYLASRSELIGAIRLPNTAFKENAGTEVTTDILFLRKPMTPTPQIGEPWIDLKEIKTHDGKTVEVNEYFANHPEMIAGRPSLEGTMHAGKEEYATLPFEDKPLGETLKELVAKLPKDVFERTAAQFVDFEGLGKAEGKRERSLTVNDGALALVSGGRFVDPVTFSDAFRVPDRVKQAVQYVALTETYRDLISMQNDPEATDAAVEAQRKKLNEVYDRYVKRYGPLNGRTSDYLSFEASYYLTLGLERENITIDPKTEKASKSLVKADVFSKRTQQPTVEPQTAASIADAVPIALSFKGRLDTDYIGSLLGIKPEEAERQMLESGAAFKNPESGLLETPDAYLSGNVRKKLAQAKGAAAEDQAYKPNVEALEKVQPELKPFRKIRAFIGSTWIPPQLMTEFARSIFHSRSGGIQYNQASDMWIVGGFQNTPQVTQTYGTNRRDGEEIISALLNQKTLKIYDTIEVGDSTRRVLNEVETQKVSARADKLQAEFQSWLRGNETAQQTIETAFNEAANNYVERKFEIARLDLPGASNEISLRANQRNAVWRFVQELHGLVGHTVGAGKTMIYISVAMEARRLGLAKKPMIAVMNSTLGQFAAAFRKMYPSGNLLVGTQKDFEASNRKRFLSRIASGDYDAIVIPHSQFNMLPDDPRFEAQMTNELLDELRAALAEATAAAGNDAKKDPTVKQIEKQIEKMEDRLRELADRRTEDLVTFQDLGVDLLIVDEAHEFKKPPFVTKRDRISGLSVDTSQRAFSLYLKARYIQSRRQGKGVILGTGTPVTNTLGEAWHMLNIASPHILRDYKVDTFDRFLSTFTLISQEFDVNAVGKLIVRDKLSRFVNIPQLVKMIRSSWDIITQDDLRPILEAQGELYPKIKGGKVQAVVVPRTEAVKKFTDFLLEVYEAYKNLDGADKREYNYIPVMTFLAGKAAALDIRLVDRTAKDDPGSKINAVVADVFKIWSETKAAKLHDKANGKDITAPLTQAVFIDQMNPFTNGVRTLTEFASGSGVDYAQAGEEAPEVAEDLFLYNDIRKKLVKLGVPESQILIVNEHDTKKPEASLMFDRINRGDVRVVLGSTAKMGVGVNMQRLMYKLHHVDVPWFPALLEQRNGRIERPGNLNPEIEMSYYGMEKTADVGLYAKNESKAKWAQQILSGRVTTEESEDPMSAMILTMQEQMAQLSGDPMLFEKVQLESRIRTLKMQREAFEDDQYRKQSTKKELTGSIRSSKESIAENTPLLAELNKRLGSILVPEGQTPVYDATVAGMKYTVRKDVLAALEASLNQHRSLLLKKAGEKAYVMYPKGGYELESDERHTVGKINGLLVRAGWEAKKEMVYEKDADGKTTGTMQNKAGVTAIWFLLDNGTNDVDSMKRLPSGYPQTADGALRSLNEIPARITSDLEQSDAYIKRAKQEIEEIDRLLQAKFAGEQELAEAEARYQEIREFAATGQGPRAAKLADELFEIHDTAAPLLVRLRSALDAAEKKVAKVTEAADPTQKEDDQAITDAEERVAALNRRLAVVEKARMEGEFSGDAELLGYGLTPSTRPGIRFLDIEEGTDQQPDTTYSALLSGGADVETILDALERNARNDFERALVLKLRSLGLKTNVRLVTRQQMAQLGNPTAKGMYRTTDAGDEILILDAAVNQHYALLHELIHAASAQAIELKPEFRLELEAMMREAQAALGGEEYGFKNAHEFLAEAFSNAAFQKRLESIKPGKQNLWQRFMGWLRKVFGVTAEQAPLFERVIRAGSREFTARDTNLRITPPPLLTEGEAVRPARPQETRIQGRKLGIASKPLPPDIPAQITHAQNVLSQFGLPVTMVKRPDMRMPGNPVKTQWRFAPDGQNHDAAGMALADYLEQRLREGDPAEQLLLSNLTTSIAGSIADGEAAAVGADGRPMLSEPVRDRLLNLTQAPASHAGQVLALRGQHSFDPEGVLEYARDVGVHLRQVWRENILGADSTGGPQLVSLLERLLKAFREYFSDAEVTAALKPLNLEATIDRLIQLNERDMGGRVYRAVQARLKAKRPKSEAMKERQAKEEEAVEAMIRQAAELGKIEPPKPKNQKLTPDEQLALLTQPEVAEQIQAAMEHAIADAERTAGVRATVAAAEQDDRPAIIASFQELDEDGNWVNYPEPDMIEEGLSLPEFEHWRLLRDNLLQYSPTTVKAVQAVITGRFRGTRFTPEEVKPPDLRIDLKALAVAPDDEVQRVFGGQLRQIQQLMTDADTATVGRVSQMFEEMLVQQLAMARQREVDRLFAERATGRETPEAIELLKRQINAGLLRDQRLSDAELAQRVASRAIFRNNLPTVGKLIKRILEAPRYKLADIRSDLAAALVNELGLTGQQAAELSKLVYLSLEGTDAKPGPLRRARVQALEKVKAELSPAERKIEFGKGRTMWQRIERGVRAGLFDPGSVLEDLAREKGYTIPTEEQKAKMRALAEEEMRLRTPTQSEIDKHGLELATRYAEKGTESLRVPLIKQMQANWSRLAHPIKFLSFDSTLAQNRAKAVNEFVASNLLLTTGFFFRQGIDVGLVSMPLNAINRSLAHLTERGVNPAELQAVLKEMMTARLSTLSQTVKSATYTAMGSSNRKVLDRAAHSLAIFDRANAKADELEASGNQAGAMAYRLSTILRAGYRIAETWDVVQSVGTEWQEMRQQLSTDLKMAGKSRGEINTVLDELFGGIKLDMAEGVKMAEAMAAERKANPTALQLQENAWSLVKALAYDRMRQLAGNGTNYEAENEQLKELRAWNLPETGGVGGVLAETIKGIRARTEQAGVPTGGLFSFGNAIGTATNRMLTFMGGGLFGGWGFGNSPWYAGERNKRERRLEAMEGMAVIALVAAMAAAGMILVQVKYPDDKDEKERFIAEGHKINTVRFNNPDGRWFEAPIQMSPFSFIAPALYMIGGIQKIATDRDRAQKKLDAEAARRGLPAEQLPGMGAGEVMSVLAQGAYGMLTGGRTAFGAIQSFSDYGNFNLNRAASSVIRPYVPGLPAWGEAARAMGAVMDTRTASFLELLVPTPWSGNQRVNALGDPLRNQDDAVRVLQTLSGGFGFGRQTPDQHAYRQLFAAGYSPQEASRTRGYNFGGVFRPMTTDEIERYSAARGEAFKEELQGVEVEGLPEAEALKQVRAAFARANSRALAGVGVTVARPSSTSAGRARVARPEASAFPTIPRVARSGPSIRRPTRRIRTGRRSTFAKGPSLRIGRGLRTPRGVRLRRTSLRKLTVRR